ncbi:hypothetical protein HN419_00785 [Candidatus Woesearchaeota archaeon]|jgi:Zn-dependent protease|nr:hypothetical protein [Candidatus Woesearchaeota archaeon]MBT3537467.1 hypothetical protein [Candidatus Woesearchaeota archaeon]MBT4696936.1 hypothetical protein [Candidatus Woesearchaeota archaeon]MBT4717342.1 hypothetical protein [Candidatus Woesearchaeota archaeon]MBT7106223.1 hypothetical protein [Candidatus Woesearchaeota archaeon]
MIGERSLWQSIKTNFKFSKHELVAIVVSILIIGFIVSFRSWGEEVFDAKVGLYNFINALIVSVLAVIASQSVTRIMGLDLGFKVEYRIWIYGVLIGLVLCIVTRGHIWFLVPGGIILHEMVGHRLGYFRYWAMHRQRAAVASAGPFANLALALLFKILWTAGLQNPVVHMAIVVNVWYAFFQMLPIPPLNGSVVFFFSRLQYAVKFGLVLGCALFLVYVANIWLALFGALVFTILGFAAGLKYG